jgi:transposase
MVCIIEGLAGDWHRLDERIEGLSGEIEAIAHQNVGCERRMSVPGIGPIISSAMVAAIGAGDAFSKGRDFAAWLGLVPRQISTGDRTILGKISKRGNRYLRVLFVQAAWAVLIKPKSWERHGFKRWLEAARKRPHYNVLAIARANKLARIAWSVLGSFAALSWDKQWRWLRHQLGRRLRFWAMAASTNSSCAPRGPRRRRRPEPKNALQVREPHLDALTVMP